MPVVRSLQMSCQYLIFLKLHKLSSDRSNNSIKRAAILFILWHCSFKTDIYTSECHLCATSPTNALQVPGVSFFILFQSRNGLKSLAGAVSFVHNSYQDVNICLSKSSQSNIRSSSHWEKWCNQKEMQNMKK